jgi:hypothetical protein
MTEKTSFTAQEVADIMERQQTIAALSHAITMGQMRGDTPEFINPLVKLYNLIINPPAPQQPEKESESEEKPGDEG